MSFQNAQDEEMSLELAGFDKALPGSDMQLVTISTNVFDITVENINKMSADYMPLVIKGLDDKEGYDAVHEARQIVKNKRIAIRKASEEFKRSIKKVSSQVDAQAQVFFDLIEPIEAHLDKEEKAIDNEKLRIKEEKEKAAQARLQDRINQLSQCNHPIHMGMVSSISDEEFNELLARAKKNHEAEQERLAAIAREQQAAIEAQKAKEAEEAAARRAEAEKLAVERAEIEAERKRIDDEKRALQAEKDSLAAAERGRIQLEEVKRRETEAKELEEKNRKEAEERAKLQSELEEKQKTEEAARLEALKPDKEKLVDFGKRLAVIAKMQSNEIKFSTKEADDLLEAWLQDIADIVIEIGKFCDFDFEVDY
jgi:colicin import membrane protein